VRNGLVATASVLTMLIASVALLGWSLGSWLLVRVIPSTQVGVMMPNTAVGLLLGGAALGLLHKQETSLWRLGLGRALASGCLLLGVTTLAEYLFRVEHGIDLLLFGRTVQDMITRMPGRPAPVTALGFCLGGTALLLMSSKAKKAWLPIQLLALGLALISFLSLITYMYRDESLLALGSQARSVTPFTPMAVHTAAAFLLLSLGLLFAQPELGLMGVLARDDAGGFMARRLLPAVLLIPLLVGGVRLMGEWLGFYGTTIGDSAFAFISMALLAAVVMRNAHQLSLLDVSRRHAQELLEASERRFRTAFEDAPLGMALVALDGALLNVNASLCKLFGYSAQELLTKTLQDITWPEDLEADLLNMSQLMEGQLSSYQLEKRYLHKQGHLITGLLTGSLVRDTQGKPRYFIGQLQDISERKRLEQTLRMLGEAGPRLAGTLDLKTVLAVVARLMIPELADWCVVGLLDEHEQLHWIESAAAEPRKDQMLRELITTYPEGLSGPGHIASNLLPLAHPSIIEQFPVAQLGAGAQSEHDRELIRGIAGGSLMGVPLETRGRVLGSLLLASAPSWIYGARELALAKELASRAALAIDNARLHTKSEQAVRARDEVLRIVAHDLRAPLQLVSLNTGLLKAHLPKEEADCQKRLDSILRAVDRGNRLIQDLLDVARMEVGHLSVERKAEETSSLVEEALLLHRTLAETKAIQLELSLPQGCPALLADRGRVLQVLSNLLGNALKFTGEGGVVALRVEPKDAMVRFSVSDTGIGISPQELPHLFEPFWQARPGKREGAGLGLVIVKGLIDAHGGQLHVESTPGVGSTFSFTLPTAS
jgi:PAS domain S-box-containing protein